MASWCVIDHLSGCIGSTHRLFDRWIKDTLSFMLGSYHHMVMLHI